ncbi:MAG: helix-turn-helix domain-containing protein [Phycisphaerae bacterium]|nr:helix-turn-helix domain-containing protein [Phycisphaerae bacterium]
MDSLDELLAATRVEMMSGCEFHCDPDWRQLPRVLPEAMWYWLMRGPCLCDLEGKVRKFNPGELLMIPAGWRHEVYPARRCRVRTITVHFHVDCRTAGDITNLLSLGGVYRDRDNLFENAGRSITAEFASRRPGYLWNAEAWVRRVLVELIRRRGGGFNGFGNLAVRERLGGVLEYIDENLGSAIRAETLAEIAGVSEVYLRKLFKACRLPSPVHFIIQRRVFRACEMLTAGSLPIKKIAAECGFADMPFFYRTFRKITGQTPGGFRKHPSL